MTNEEIVALAESKGLAIRPTRTGKTYVFFVRRNNKLLFDGRALYRDEVINWLETQKSNEENLQELQAFQGSKLDLPGGCFENRLHEAGPGGLFVIREKKRKPGQ